MLGYIPSNLTKSPAVHVVDVDVPLIVDWVSGGAVTDVKD